MNDSAQSGNRTGHPWRLRDTLAAAVLFLASAGFVLWQNTRVAVLWDLGYLLDTSWRIALGQVPYRDFPLSHAPLTFIIQAGLMTTFGRHYEVVVVYAALAGGLGTVLSWRILLRVLSGVRHGWWIALLLAAPLVVLGVYAVYPHPIYDCDCALAILFALRLLHRAESRRGAFVAGLACVLPPFFKQNMGLPFLAAVGCAAVACWLAERRRNEQRHAALLAGMILGTGCSLVVLSATAGMENYARWTLQFAAQRRMPGLAAMLSVYAQPAFPWMVPLTAAGLSLCFTRALRAAWGRAVAFALIAAPLLATVVIVLRQDNAEDRTDSLLVLWPVLLIFALPLALLNLRRALTIPALLPFLLLIAIHGTFLSQQLWGSTYAIWPLLMILIASLMSSLPQDAGVLRLPLAVVCCATFALCGGLYAVSLERLSYVNVPDSPPEHAASEALLGMATPGEYLRNLDGLVEFVNRQIPPQDALLLLPGEDPFYFATGRTPQFPVTLFDPATDPFSGREIMAQARARHVRWVIVKQTLQVRENPMPDRKEAMREIERETEMYRQLPGYDIYHVR